MRGREITLWLDERWYDALSKQLKGETLEEHLENVLDEMCNQLPQREYERISHELWAEQQAEKEAREAARRFAVFHVTESGSSDYILAEENLELLRVACRLRSYIRKPPGEAPHRFVETLLRTQRISQEEFNSYVSERLNNTGRVVGAYDIDLDSGDMEAVSIMDGWKRFRIRDVSTAAYFAMKKGNAAPDERWRIFLDRLEERWATRRMIMRSRYPISRPCNRRSLCRLTFISRKNRSSEPPPLIWRSSSAAGAKSSLPPAERNGWPVTIVSPSAATSGTIMPRSGAATPSASCSGFITSAIRRR